MNCLAWQLIKGKKKFSRPQTFLIFSCSFALNATKGYMDLVCISSCHGWCIVYVQYIIASINFIFHQSVFSFSLASKWSTVRVCRWSSVRVNESCMTIPYSTSVYIALCVWLNYIFILRCYRGYIYSSYRPPAPTLYMQYLIHLTSSDGFYVLIFSLGQVRFFHPVTLPI